MPGIKAALKLVPNAPSAERELLFVDLADARNVVPVIDRGEADDNWVIVMPIPDGQVWRSVPEKRTYCRCRIVDRSGHEDASPFPSSIVHFSPALSTAGLWRRMPSSGLTRRPARGPLEIGPKNSLLPWGPA